MVVDRDAAANQGTRRVTLHESSDQNQAVVRGASGAGVSVDMRNALGC